MPAAGTLVGFPPATLQTIIDSATQCIVAGAVRGISYSIAGRSFTFPSLADAQQLMLEANYALGLANGTISTQSRANFNRGLGRGSPWA